VTDDKQLLNAIFRVRSAIDCGTGFLFGDGCHVLTAKHVVVTAEGKPAPNITVEAVQGKPEPVKSQRLLGFCDVALLELSRTLPAVPLQPSSSQDLKPGAEVRAAGFPVHVSERWQPGQLVGRVRLGEYELHFDHSLTAPLSGLSGGPVLDSENRVIGLIIEHDPLTPTAGKMAPLEDFRASLDFSPGAAPCTCDVILSGNEPPAQGVLRTAVEEALDIVGADDGEKIGLTFEYATHTVSSREAYFNMVRRLCRTDVCIFDLTEYEPAVMLLLGIRSVVRRGITIGSVMKDIVRAPYDIKELNLLSHAEAESQGVKLRDAIAERMRTGRSTQSLQHYLDLPTFEAVRNLPPGRRREILPSERVLLLSSYSADADTSLRYIQDRLELELKKRKVKQPRIERVLDLNVKSPWLVSQNMYEAIRCSKLCIVDWTGFPLWPENVFFELGVRIAVRKGVTFCILHESAADCELSEQMKNLIALFNPIRYRCDDKKGEAFRDMMNAWDQRTADEAGLEDGPCGNTYREITAAIDPRQGLLARSVQLELLQAAESLSADDTEALSAVLYPENLELRSAAAAAVKDRLWAAWYYLMERYGGIEGIVKDPDLQSTATKLAKNLLAALGADSPEAKPIKEALPKLLENDVNERLQDEIRRLKNEARLLRDIGQTDRALSMIERAHSLLETPQPVQTVDGRLESDDAVSSSVKAERANLWGIRGGILRRAGRLEEARAAYRQGRELEKDDTYNRTNSIYLDLLIGPATPRTLEKEIRDARDKVERQIRAQRSRQWWAWADLGLLEMLLGRQQQADEAYRNFEESGARASDYDTVLSVLESLWAKFRESNEPVQHEFERVMARLKRMKP
jgi:hypothetical protein